MLLQFEPGVIRPDCHDHSQEVTSNALDYEPVFEFETAISRTDKCAR